MRSKLAKGWTGLKRRGPTTDPYGTPYFTIFFTKLTSSYGSVFFSAF